MCDNSRWTDAISGSDDEPTPPAEARADCETRLAALRDVTATARRLIEAEDALADAHAAWPTHIGTYDQHLRVQHAAETEVVTAKAALRAALAADPDEETT